MARIARVVAVGAPHHITQRGNNRQQVFLSDEDRQFYLATLAESCRRYEIAVLGYRIRGQVCNSFVNWAFGVTRAGWGDVASPSPQAAPPSPAHSVPTRLRTRNASDGSPKPSTPNTIDSGRLCSNRGATHVLWSGGGIQANRDILEFLFHGAVDSIRGR